MKRLILVRHAKSDWPEETEDFDRPLADKGLEEAMHMSRFMKNNNVAIDYFVSSPAVRALNTCRIFNQSYHINITTNEKLYNPSESNFESVIYDLDDNVNSVAFFSHNNGISNFANSISEDIFHFPTCGVAGFEIDCNSWSEFDGAKKRLMFFYDPGKIK
ncbi:MULTISPECIES: SixA phosphatase family protein [Chryseobacterium]|jgi:phosphohistidine phosphatase|uniref:Histidine phosphatase family protein n=1 Tax=Chryseobacterium nepalense TaxID=1854498 RepID=A0ABY4K4V4_9FLAO|nr:MULTISPECIES: histidine phosphatase family protein [Chryseobacterium]MEA1850393.1 histidine phosphatase family protein [Chryseobacterium sp. MHB01]MEC5172186.1 phosphohistidine phosphatase [Chryseobacterium nepalense]UPQ75225.1 histidine phosphatase family protein [Chryseobacterium nepalense]